MDADRSYVGQVVDVTMRYLQGQELDGLFLAGVENALKAAKEDEAVTSLLDDWLSGVCLHQLGLFSVWGRKGRWRQAYICWSNAAAKLTKMTGRAVPHVGMEEMMVELRLRGVRLSKAFDACSSLVGGYLSSAETGTERGAYRGSLGGLHALSVVRCGAIYGRGLVWVVHPVGYQGVDRPAPSDDDRFPDSGADRRCEPG